MNADVVVIGAGLVGSAIAYGLVGRNVRVLVLDGTDRDFRAATANFGLVWQQGKGMDMPAYQNLTRRSIDRWPNFSAELTAATGIDLEYEHNGGLMFCMGEVEIENRRRELLRLHHQLDHSAPDWEMLDRRSLTELFPKIELGPDVTGASLGHRDGHANPLRLLAALHAGIVHKGGQVRGGHSAHAIETDPHGHFTVTFGHERASAARVVIAAGLGSKPLAAQVGLDIPIRPQRGQILVTERLAPLLPLPTSDLRQTREGTVMIGATHDEAGFDTSITCEAAAELSAAAVRCFPALGAVRLVRQWAGLRILTPDSYPIYAESESHAGAFVAVCHSGVTLAAAHATLLADAIAAGQVSHSLAAFHHRRFDVPKAA
jgi:glycine/D-amino acid oxidase-like deaminating enzyme